MMRATSGNKKRPTANGTYLSVVIPAKAGIHLDLIDLIPKKNGFPLSRE